MENNSKPDFIVKLEEYTDSIIQNGDEPLMLATIQDKIHQFDIKDVDHFNPYVEVNHDTSTIDEAIGELSQVRTIAEMLLLRSWNTFKTDKYRYIFMSTLNLIKWNLCKKDFLHAIEHSEHVNLYIEDALEKSPNDFNTISVIFDIFYHQLYAKLEAGESFNETLNKINEYVPFLIVAADKKKYKLNTALVLGQIADILLCKGIIDESCQFYAKVLNIISEIEDIDIVEKREFAIFVGHYNVALLKKTVKDHSLIEKNLDIEESLYKQLHNAFGDIRSKMDLAIAYSHRGSYYEEIHDYKKAGISHLKKIGIIKETFFIEEESPIYTEEARLDSLFKSMQPIINYGLLTDKDERISIFKQAYQTLHDILGYAFDIRLLGYSNAFAMEIFKASDGNNDAEAEIFLFKKISTLINLVNKYGMEDGIRSDLASTIVEAKDFVNRVGTKLDPHNKHIWDVVNKVIFPNKPIIENKSKKNSFIKRLIGFLFNKDK